MTVQNSRAPCDFLTIWVVTGGAAAAVFAHVGLGLVIGLIAAVACRASTGWDSALGTLEPSESEGRSG